MGKGPILGPLCFFPEMFLTLAPPLASMVRNYFWRVGGCPSDVWLVPFAVMGTLEEQG